MISYLDKISAHKCLILNTIIRQGSPAAAARALNLPVSKIHNDIKSIEKAVGGPILLRSQRKVVLTPLGEKIAEFARVVVEGLHHLEDEEANATVRDLIISCPNGFAEVFMPKILDIFHEKHPQIMVYLYTGIEYMDFSQKDIDIAIGLHLDNRIDLAQNYLYTTNYQLYASPSYLKKYGVPKTFEDLKNHKLLNFKGIEQIGDCYNVVFNHSQIYITSNNSNALKKMCELGMGISCIAREVVEKQDKGNESLVPILSDYFNDGFRIYFLSRKFNQKSLIIQSFKDSCFDVVQQLLK